VSDAGGDGFLSRWSKRKTALREGVALEKPAPPIPVNVEPFGGAQNGLVEAPVSPADPSTSSGRTGQEEAAPAKPPAPTLEDVAKLVAGDDVKRFVAPDVDPTVKNAALKKLFTEPQFNVMDGLDTYIDDYGKPDPIPESMLRQMVQSKMLGLFADEPDERDERDERDETKTTPTNDPDPAVRLQPDDAAGPSGPAQGTEPDPGRDA
jgi:Protein of unknown function (DUF3306)